MLCYFDAPVQNGIAKDCTRIALTTRLSLHRHSRKAPAAVQIPGWSFFSSDCITSDSQGMLARAAFSLTLSHRQLRTYIRTYVHTCIHTYIRAYINTHIHAYIHTCIHTSIHTYIHINIHTSIQTYIQTYIHTDIHAYVHTYMALKSCPVSHPDHRPLDIRDLLS